MVGWLPRASGRMTAARPWYIGGQLVWVAGMATVGLPPEVGVCGFPEGGLPDGLPTVALPPGVGVGDDWPPEPHAAPSQSTGHEDKQGTLQSAGIHVFSLHIV